MDNGAPAGPRRPRTASMGGGHDQLEAKLETAKRAALEAMNRARSNALGDAGPRRTSRDRYTRDVGGTFRCEPTSQRVMRRRLGLSSRQWRLKVKADRRGSRVTAAKHGKRARLEVARAEEAFRQLVAGQTGRCARPSPTFSLSSRRWAVYLRAKGRFKARLDGFGPER